MGMGVILGGQPRSNLRGRGAAALANFGVSPLFMPRSSDVESTKFGG